MRYYRKIIRIRAIDSPNVRWALAQQRSGQQPTGEILVPGVLTWQDYKKRLATWDAVRICVGLDAQFYEGAEVLMFPPDWLNRAERFADALQGRPRQAKAIGVDPAEGGDKTSMAVIDELGLIELVSRKTPDTSVVTSEALALMRRHNVLPENVVFDRGGGGKQHADRLRQQGYPVRTVAFGEALTVQPKRGIRVLPEKIEQKEQHYAWVNRRAQMYGELRDMLDPIRPQGFALPAKYVELRRQLGPIPLTFDPEGRLYLLPKNKKDKDSKVKTLVELIGNSPDEADSLVLALHGLLHKSQRKVAGAI